MYPLKTFMKIFILMFPMIFQSSMGLRNQGVIVPNGTTQGNFYSWLKVFPLSTCENVWV